MQTCPTYAYIGHQSAPPHCIPHDRIFGIVLTLLSLLSPTLPLQPVTGKQAEALVQKCPMNVFDIEDLPRKGIRQARVARPRDCTMCRECIREGEWAEKIQLKVGGGRRGVCVCVRVCMFVFVCAICWEWIRQGE